MEATEAECREEGRALSGRIGRPGATVNEKAVNEKEKGRREGQCFFYLMASGKEVCRGGPEKAEGGSGWGGGHNG